MALQINWQYKLNIHSEEDIMQFVHEFMAVKPRFSSLDSESDGLHILQCTPFLISFGFYNYDELIGYTYTFDLEKHPNLVDKMMYALIKTFNKSERTVFWNVKFDNHLLANVGYIWLFDNATDALVYARLAHDAKGKKEGGMPDKLKEYATKFITPQAKRFEAKLKNERKIKKNRRNQELKERLKSFPIPDYLRVTGTERSWTMKMIEEFFSDKTNEIEDLPKNIQPVVRKWLEDTPDPDNYRNLNRDNVTLYAHYDIIYTLEAFHQCYPVALVRGQEDTIKREEKIMRPLYDMERIGFNFNMGYAKQAKIKVKTYLKQRRRDLHKLAGFKVKPGQAKVIKGLLNNKFKIPTPSTEKKVLNEYLKEPEKYSSEGIEFIKTLNELRTLEKWYSTYIIKWIQDAENGDGRIYTQIKQYGTVSGRVSSNFQQFPKKPIYDNKGNELFHPRRMIKVSGNGYDRILYLDYSQIEMRLQALYTILVADGDLNMCRAYMPFKCYHYDSIGNKHMFDYNNNDHLKDWNKLKKGHPDPKEFKDGITDVLNQGWSIWYKEENNEPWGPTDLHNKTTEEAFHITPDHPNFTDRRSEGKMGNFAITYGAAPAALSDQLFISIHDAQAIYNGYMKAYPKVIDYRKWIKRHNQHYGYIENLFGRKYYGTNAHLGSNYAIQGSGADFLKEKMYEVWKFLKEKEYKTRYVLNVHDELVFDLYNGEDHIIPELISIMEVMPGTKVPIVVDPETTKTTWDEKEDYHVT
jgi:DNA polymerase-1